MVRIGPAALAALLATAAPALAQVTYAPEVAVPAALVAAPGATVPRMRYRVVLRTLLVPHTRYVRRTVLVPRTRYVRRVLRVPVTTYAVRASAATIPVGPYALGRPVAGYAPVYAGTGLVGPTWVPPGTSYPCVLGTVGCDSSVVGTMGF